MVTESLRQSLDDERKNRLGIRESLMSFFDTGLRTRRTFQSFRLSADYDAIFAKEEPLVSVCIGTYNRARLLTERALPSIIGQSYPRLDIIVVGDACTDDTAERVESLQDTRVRFVNLPRRGDYPVEPAFRWMVAGTASMNHALSLAAGDFVTHLDDDDEHAADRIEKLLSFIRAQRADIVFHPFEYETVTGEWRVNAADGFRASQVTTSSVLYHNWFRQLDWDPFAYRFSEPGDWNRFRRMKFLGARAVRFPESLLKHYKEGNQVAGP